MRRDCVCLLYDSYNGSSYTWKERTKLPVLKDISGENVDNCQRNRLQQQESSNVTSTSTLRPTYSVSLVTFLIYVSAASQAKSRSE